MSCRKNGCFKLVIDNWVWRHFIWCTNIRRETATHAVELICFACYCPERTVFDLGSVQSLSCILPTKRQNSLQTNKLSLNWVSKTGNLLGSWLSSITLGLRNLCVCSKIFREVETWPMQLRPGRKPARFSKMHPSSVISNRQGRLSALSLIAMLTNPIYLWFPPEELSSFLEIGAIADSPIPAQIEPSNIASYDVNILPSS